MVSVVCSCMCVCVCSCILCVLVGWWVELLCSGDVDLDGVVGDRCVGSVVQSHGCVVVYVQGCSGGVLEPVLITLASAHCTHIWSSSGLHTHLVSHGSGVLVYQEC